MTLTECEGAPTREGGYVIFYSSRDGNQMMWCPVSIPFRLLKEKACGLSYAVSAEIFVIQDCREVEATVASAFDKVDGRIVYVGNRAE
jgi:hypothetical protein